MERRAGPGLGLAWCRWLGLLWLVAAQQAAGNREAKAQSRALRSRGIFPAYDGLIDADGCECSCCIVQGRRPSEVVGAISAKCGLPPPDRQRCSFSRCSVVNDKVLRNSKVIDLERFCFYRCQPQSNLQPSDKNALNAKAKNLEGGFIDETSCVPVPDDLQGQAEDSDGNGRDAALPPADQ
mmetsp:Transcript_30332/g.66384  ORF Transcript_30332/g.66384 Transcript_30332/m.66384 type:complete len:181 (-) Transcript_30332:62-604(-)